MSAFTGWTPCLPPGKFCINELKSVIFTSITLPQFSAVNSVQCFSSVHPHRLLTLGRTNHRMPEPSLFPSQHRKGTDSCSPLPEPLYQAEYFLPTVNLYRYPGNIVLSSRRSTPSCTLHLLEAPLPLENHTLFDFNLLLKQPAQKGPWNKSPAQYNPKGHYVLELFIT